MQDLWRSYGDRGLFLLASAAFVQQRDTATYAHHGRLGQASTRTGLHHLIATRTVPVVCIQRSRLTGHQGKARQCGVETAFRKPESAPHLAPQVRRC